MQLQEDKKNAGDKNVSQLFFYFFNFLFFLFFPCSRCFMLTNEIGFWCIKQLLPSLNSDLLQCKSNTQFVSIKLGETVAAYKNVEWNSATICNVSIHLVSLKTI